MLDVKELEKTKLVNIVGEIPDVRLQILECNGDIKEFRLREMKNIDKQSEIQSIALSLMYDKIYDVFNRKFSKYKNYEMDFIQEGYFSILYMMQEISPSLKDDEIEQYVDVCINNYMQKYVDFLRKRGEL